MSDLTPNYYPLAAPVTVSWETATEVGVEIHSTANRLMRRLDRIGLEGGKVTRLASKARAWDADALRRLNLYLTAGPGLRHFRRTIHGGRYAWLGAWTELCQRIGVRA